MKNLSKKIYITMLACIFASNFVFSSFAFLPQKALACIPEEPVCEEGEELIEYSYNSKPQFTYIDESDTNVANQLCSCGYLEVDTTDGETHYIYMKWDDVDYSDYEEKFAELKQEMDSLSTDDWFRNLYWNWLYVLKSLLNEFGNGYQTFMQTQAWQDKELSTALASWTELRHDTILYVKQSYTMAELGGGPGEPPVVGYVEPVPEFYARLLTLTKMTNTGLKNLVPQQELEELKIETTLSRFSEILTRLLAISKKELENKALTEDEYSFIENFGDVSKDLIETVSGGDVDPEIFETILVADVHTEGNTKKVLEEGVGYIKTLVVAYKHPDGHILIGAGPVFSYYEFKQPMENRLTDEVWQQMLNTQSPTPPEWTKTFSE